MPGPNSGSPIMGEFWALRGRRIAGEGPTEKERAEAIARYDGRSPKRAASKRVSAGFLASLRGSDE